MAPVLCNTVYPITCILVVFTIKTAMYNVHVVGSFTHKNAISWSILPYDTIWCGTFFVFVPI